MNGMKNCRAYDSKYDTLLEMLRHCATISAPAKTFLSLQWFKVHVAIGSSRIVYTVDKMLDDGWCIFGDG